MLSTSSTFLDQISTEKTRVSERLARLNTERATVATRLTDLETAERVLTRVSKTPPSRRPTSAAAAETKAPAAGRGRGRPPKAAATKSAAHKPSAPSLGERVLARLRAGPNRNFTWRAPAIARTMSASPCSATSALDGSRSETANCMQYRPQPSGRTQHPGLTSAKWLVVVHPIHSAAGRHCRRSLLLWLFGDHRLGRDQEARHRGRVLQCQPHYLGRIDDAGLDHVDVVAGLRVKAAVEVISVEACRRRLT